MSRVLVGVKRVIDYAVKVNMIYKNIILHLILIYLIVITFKINCCINVAYYNIRLKA